MITVYHAPHSRSTNILWLLEELGEPYKIELTPIVYGNGQGTPAPETYRRIHPHKKVPAIDHDSKVVIETSAIVLYLAETFPRAKLAPPVGSKERAAYLMWITYYSATMLPIIGAHFRGWDKEGSPTGFGLFDEMENFLANTLEERPYIAGDEFTAADTLLGSGVEFFRSLSVLPDRKVYNDYVARIVNRPARLRAFAKDNG